MAVNPEELSTDELYFSDNEYMSNSKFKRFNRCERLGLTDFGKPTTPLLVGSFVDSYVSGELDKFKEEHPEIFYKNDKTKLKADFRQAEKICEFIDNDRTIRDFLSGDKQSVFTGEIGGVPYKAKLDIYSEGIAINDLKIMRSITDRSGNYYDFITNWRYDIQGAIYQELVYQNTGERLPFFIVAVTKETPINSAIINIDQNTLDLALDEVKGKSKHYYDIWKGLEVPNGCGICKECISSRLTTPIISLQDLQLTLDN